MKGSRTKLVMDKRYNPADFESKWYEYWQEKGYFHSTPDSGRTPFVIVIPPPNVTGVLHMGHGLNNTIQDILCRYHRKKGYNTCWVPGTDHAGIATQNVVERKLARGGETRKDLGREAFLQEVWKWKNEHGSTIIRQLKKIGASCDWDRERFTMDDGLSNAVLEVFIRLYEKGLVYRGEYIVNWCPRCQTALSDEESEHRQVPGKLYHFRYPVEGSSECITIATTRPETMLGDTAVAMHPEDERYSRFKGKRLLLPLLNRSIPIIEDSFVDREFGTGLVKVTPSHDPNDFEMGRRHNLEFINILNPDGTLNENAGPYSGLDRFTARKRVLEDLEKAGLIEKIEEHHHAVGHCYRCDTIVEPYVSRQWFVKMKPLSIPAIEAVTSGRVRFFPERWTRVYLHWMENIRDWCISRQIWWGHRIPVWYVNGSESDFVVARTEAEAVQKARERFGDDVHIEQDPDVLDTWFSSALWPFSVFGWPKNTPELNYYYPTSVLVTDPGIIFFWVARMIMMGLEFQGEIPFSDVNIHGTVMDAQGRKMSKSLGNGIDPLEVVEEFGADALRFTIISIAPLGQDLLLSREKFSVGQNFANKIWNAARFLKMRLPSDVPPFVPEELTLLDRWILHRWKEQVDQLQQEFRNYRLNEAAKSIYSFFWHTYCDWYLEFFKVSLQEGVLGTSPSVALKVFREFLHYLHPYMPFISEELYQEFPGGRESIVIESFPECHSPYWSDDDESWVQLLMDIIAGVRNIRGVFAIPPAENLPLTIEPSAEFPDDIIGEHQVYIQRLARVSSVEYVENIAAKSRLAKFVTRFGTAGVELGDQIEVDKERDKTEKEITQLEKEVTRIEERLTNDKFLSRAPEHVVEKNRANVEQFKEKLKRLRRNYELMTSIRN